MSHVSIRMSLVALATSFGAVALASADGVKFESMAPKGSAMVVSLKNLNATAARLEASPLGQIMKAPEIESAVAQVRKDLATQRKTDLQALGIEAEEVPWPGPTGLAVFVERNEELDAPELGVLWWADYEGRADAAGEVFAGVIRELEKEAGKSFEQVDIQGGVYVGRRSYGCYLFHWSVWTVMVGRDLFSSKTEGFSVIGVFIAFAITVGVSAGSYRFFETPFLRYRKRFQRVVSP